MPRIIHFDLGAENPARAKGFYEKVFDWKLEKWEGPMEYWMAYTGSSEDPGINGGVFKRDKSSPPSPATTIGVKSIDGILKKIEQNGGKAVGKKMPIPGVGWYAAFKDTEGNLIGLMQEDPKAK